jgi:hypothetical protein
VQPRGNYVYSAAGQIHPVYALFPVLKVNLTYIMREEIKYAKNSQRGADNFAVK